MLRHWTRRVLSCASHLARVARAGGKPSPIGSRGIILRGIGGSRSPLGNYCRPSVALQGKGILLRCSKEGPISDHCDSVTPTPIVGTISRGWLTQFAKRPVNVTAGKVPPPSRVLPLLGVGPQQPFSLLQVLCRQWIPRCFALKPDVHPWLRGMSWHISVMASTEGSSGVVPILCNLLQTLPNNGSIQVGNVHPTERSVHMKVKGDHGKVFAWLHVLQNQFSHPLQLSQWNERSMDCYKERSLDTGDTTGCEPGTVEDLDGGFVLVESPPGNNDFVWQVEQLLWENFGPWLSP